MQLIGTFKKFLEDENAFDMYITGQAGTGKTTSLKELVDFCYETGVPSICCAYTHKAKRILANKMGPTADCRTLWSFMGKRPSINTEASNVKHLQTSIITGESERVRVVFIDEYSMVGERDLMDLRELQEPDENNKEDFMIKYVWLGDLNQLPPVGDMQTIAPTGKYAITLNKIWRQSSESPLIDTLSTLVNYIEGKVKPKSLPSNSAFSRNNQNLISLYKEDKSKDKIALAYTNEQVQYFNFCVEDKEYPDLNDTVFSATMHKKFTYLGEIDSRAVTFIHNRNGEILELGTKYKTLEYLKESNFCKFFCVVDEEGDEYILPVIFGTYNYRQKVAEASNKAVASNQKIEEECNTDKAATWARINNAHPLARERGQAWRKYLTLNEFVHAMDFSHCMTVHKSQGSTYENVYVDIKNLYKCAERDYKLYLKLLYVAISRASNKVWTN